jgi:hypothetical protein
MKLLVIRHATKPNERKINPTPNRDIVSPENIDSS